MSDAMSTDHSSLRPTCDRAQLELRCLGRALIPMPEQDPEPTVVAKIVALVLAVAWAAITVGMAFEGVDTVAPPYYGLFTALIFLLVGKLWDVEVKRLLPTDN